MGKMWRRDGESEEISGDIQLKKHLSLQAVLTLCAGVCLASAASATAQIIANSLVDFSGTQGQANWRYGYANGSGPTPWTAADFTEFADFSTGVFSPDLPDSPNYWHLQEGPGGFWTAVFYDGGMTNGPVTSGQRQPPEQWSIRRWVSTVSGPIAISGVIGDQPQSCGDGIRAVIRVDDVDVFIRDTAGNTPAVGYSVMVNVSPGSLVDFIAKPKNHDYCDDYKFIAQIVHASDGLTVDSQWVGNGHWYRAVYVPNMISWQQASRAAMTVGGHLATPTSEEENQFIFNLVNAPIFWRDGLTSLIGPWIGGLQSPCPEEPLCGWQWLTGEPWSYTNWQVGQPDNTNLFENRLHFSSADANPAATWDDARSDLLAHGYIIEWDSKPYVSSLLRSTFEFGMDGWGIYGDNQDLAWNRQNGNPGGCVIATDRVLGINNGFLAPTAFLGNHAAVFGGTLRYDIRPASPATAAGWEVLLSGAGMHFTIAAPDATPNVWNTRRLPLTPTAGWMKFTPSGNVPPTEAEFQSLLANLNAIEIGADFLSGLDSASLDNVVLAVRYDLDLDGDVDSNDVDLFGNCFSGPAVPYNPLALPVGCTLTPDANGLIAADFDSDADVDQVDFGWLQRCYGGEDLPVDPLCEN